MVLSQLTIFLFVACILTTFAAQLPAPFKQCTASSVGEITKASVNAPCTKEYCTFYKGTDARLEFTFLLSKIIQIKKNTRIFMFVFFLNRKESS
jgi:hypothetical protein